MSTLGLSVFDSSLQKTYLWLNDVAEALELDPEPKATRHKRAYSALRSVLHALRDHLTVDEVAQLSAQLPLVLRGVYYEGWDPTGKPLKERNKMDFFTRVYNGLSPSFDATYLSDEDVTRAVLGVLAARVSAGEVNDLRSIMPRQLRELWPQPARGALK